MQDAEAMTPYEYHLRMKANALKELDKEYDLHKVAFYNQAVQATKQKGKKSEAVYKKLTDFFNYEKIKEEMFGIKKVKVDKNARLKELILKANKKGG